MIDREIMYFVAVASYTVLCPKTDYERHQWLSLFLNYIPCFIGQAFLKGAYAFLHFTYLQFCVLNSIPICVQRIPELMCYETVK